jgi:hypothetical protein
MQGDSNLASRDKSETPFDLAGDPPDPMELAGSSDIERFSSAAPAGEMPCSEAEWSHEKWSCLMPVNADPITLRSTVIVLTIALEETLKTLAAQNSNQPGPWLDEVQDLALLRGKAALLERASSDDPSASASALEITEAIFAKIRSSFPGVVIDP